jgi:radical SAM-linked protein
MALLGHLDLIRELPRVLRRVGVRMAYTKGFHPKPDMSFGPALSLGVMSLDEYTDVRLAEELDAADLPRLVTRMNTVSPSGLVFRDVVRLGPEDAGITKAIAAARYLLIFARSALEVGAAEPLRAEDILEDRCRAAMAAASLPIRRDVDGIGKVVDVRAYLERANVAAPEALLSVGRAGLFGDVVAIDVDVAIRGSGAVKSSEIAAVIAGDGVTAPPHRAVRLELFGRAGAERVSPLDLARTRRAARSTDAGSAKKPAQTAAAD